MTLQSDIAEPSWIPLGLSFIASNLRQQGHEVSIFDRFARQARLRNDRNQVNREMLAHIESFKPDLIGFNTVSPLIFDTVECISLIRKSYQGLLVAGGHHASALPELTLQKIPGLDGIICGEGEISMSRLAGGEAPHIIPGIWWRTQDGISCSGPAEQIKNLDQLPFPAFDLLDMPFYTRPGLQAVRGHYLSAVSILASRGCPHQCEFCSESLTYGRGLRRHSPEYVGEWVQKAVADYQVGGIYFHDNDFLVNHAWAESIAHQFMNPVIGRKIKWSVQARADQLDEGLLRLLKQAGCVQIEIGIETSSQQDLDKFNKKTTVDMNEKAIALCKKAGLNVHAYMMVGFENEGIKELEEKLKWLKKAAPTSFSWNLLGLYPGTALYLKNGNDYFAREEWSEKSITEFYQQSTSNIISREAMGEWLNKHYHPYRKWHHRRNVLRVNNPAQIFQILCHKANKEIQSRLEVRR